MYLLYGVAHCGVLHGELTISQSTCERAYSGTVVQGLRAVSIHCYYKSKTMETEGNFPTDRGWSWVVLFGK